MTGRGLFPALRVSGVKELTPAFFREKGIRAVIFDIDNTLVPHGAPADEQSLAYFRLLHAAGIETAFVSNNHEARVKPFAEAVSSLYLCDAGKPSRRGYRAVMERLGVRPEETASVGDQIFTDVWGANRSGVFSILVMPVGREEPFTVKLKRLPEKIVLFLAEIREKRLKKRRA